MDVQMPVMDGIEASRQIRALEKKLGRHTPLIAMTAHALKGDRVEILTSGSMDDYVSKPIELKRLKEVIERQLTRPLMPSFEREAALERLGDDEDLLRDILATFLADAPQQLAEIEAAIVQTQAESFRLLHTLKGSSSGVGAARLSEAARRAESLARSGSWPELEGLLPEIKRLFEEFRQEALRYLDLIT